MRIHNGPTELHVAEDGDPSAPPILLLHGITSCGATWEWIVPTLAERYRVLRLDFRGHGGSARATGGYGPVGYTSDAVAAIEQVAGKPCTVIGHSLGGATAATLTQRHADLVVAAVMEDPPLGSIGRPDVKRGEATGGVTAALEGNSLLESFKAIRESVPRLQESGVSAELLAGILAGAPMPAGPTFGEVLHPDALAAMAVALLAVDARVLDPVLDGTLRSFVDANAAFQVPSLIVCADPSKPDAVADPARAGHFAEISPSTSFTVIEGAGHLIHDEVASRDRFLELTLDFLDRVAATTAG